MAQPEPTTSLTPSGTQQAAPLASPPPSLGRRGLERGVQRLLQRLARTEERSARLAKYVPGAILEQIDRGVDPACGLREVTVVFVDLHGFTGFCESLGAEEVFQVLSAYTRCASNVVRAHGGTVVEFNGDGMMAVFGAPEALAAKEQAGVSTARMIARELFAGPALNGSYVPPVGIGVATGEAYVGSIPSADRLIWSAVGNTTNLASRLQWLTHSLSTPIVIDEPTRESAGLCAREFARHEGIRIRGRREPVDVFAWPETLAP